MKKFSFISSFAKIFHKGRRIFQCPVMLSGIAEDEQSWRCRAHSAQGREQLWALLALPKG